MIHFTTGTAALLSPTRPLHVRNLIIQQLALEPQTLEQLESKCKGGRNAIALTLQQVMNAHLCALGF